MALAGVEAGGFGVEDDLSHGAFLSSSMPRLARGVGAFVFRVAGVALHPDPFEAVMGRLAVEFLPEFDVLHRLFVGGAQPFSSSRGSRS